MHEGEKEHMVVGPNAEEPKGSFWDAIRRFFKRILFHISAFIIGAILSTHVPQIHPGEAALGVYLGLICIVARGASRKPSWIVPAVSGAGLAVLLILFGMPFPYALFWGGFTHRYPPFCLNPFSSARNGFRFLCCSSWPSQ